MRAPLCSIVSAGIALLSMSLAGSLAAATEPARVAAARKAHQKDIAALFEKAHLRAPPKTLLLRAFKEESALELWAGEKEGAPLTLLKTYKICARSGGPGPKSREGDGQVPEGFYKISRMNPWSSYHLSLQVDYPNAADRARAKSRGIEALGGDIFIHGNCVTIGCMPIEDGPIEELYVIAQDASARGARLAVHLFPARPKTPAWDALRARASPPLQAFWDSLQQGYDAFEAAHVLPELEPTAEGNYRLRLAASPNGQSEAR